MAASQATPIVVGGFLSLIVGVGGPPAYVWGFFTSGVFNIMVMFSLAELACVYPCAAGQIYWSGILSKTGHNRALSYACGWTCSFGWFLWFGGTTILVAEYICALVEIYRPESAFKMWQVYLVNVAVIIICFIWNAPLFKVFSKSATAVTYLFNLGALFIFIALLVKAAPKKSPRQVFVELINETGWSSDGFVFLIAAGPLTACLSAFDTATHLADEMPNPSRTVPIVMISSTLINLVTGFAMCMVQMFCTVNLQNFLDPIGKQPLIQLLHDSFESDALLIISCIILVIAGFCSATSVLITGSRSLWSFARLDGTPFSVWLGEIDSRYCLPMNALYTLTAATITITAVSMGSTTALNAILGGGGICIFISYIFPISQLVLVGRNVLPQNRRLNLGVVGAIFNWVSFFWIPFIVIVQCFPLYLPVTAGTMNYTLPIIGGVSLLGILNWLMHSKNLYKIPQWTIDGIPVEDSVIVSFEGVPSGSRKGDMDKEK
ncbi:hypothetical protein PENSTE_c031G08536 [Penicillium steckii]|uniref:Amino acid permease/ SLC12A domain-containing protein n=1 Tax=Penicillium steckii TaxID=303698 RepID=A0A1V6SLN0_9EURO|nr:hypothetical protein PENSTE_c031G08536 [Penicillium steckii]